MSRELWSLIWKLSCLGEDTRLEVQPRLGLGGGGG